MENLPDFDTILTALTDWTARILSIELPIPDAALVLAFVLMAYALRLNTRAIKEDVRADIEEIYQAELLLANRRTQQAKGDLRKAQMEIERERQKRRREAVRNDSTRRVHGPRLVEAAQNFQQV
ncbi:hypothetical protein BC777_0362 [Yoonia maricola]|uniref:Uncharacterized protein n=1 Tax=Yoonia maricola TaxID=420999 RepID=A0A2M8WKS9_9RHOB|nr:hypothetical protein [Yoonia maricola]PJI91533.1 hypothetical protein BC777_0362 [Yoonia maricola]